ncbi:MAG: hypothetical protein ABIZ95_13265 [Pyrinomonadaceae bacterium]
MKKNAKRVLGFVALAAGAAGTVFIGTKKMQLRSKKRRSNAPSIWARPGMRVTFRAELMPGRDPEARTFLVNELLPSGRVSLQGREGEHNEREFEMVR